MSESKIVKFVKEYVAISMMILAGFSILFPFYEFALIQAAQDTDQIVVTQTVTAGISMGNCADVTMTALTLTQNTAVGSSTCAVTTNNQAGYTLYINAADQPALRSADTGESFTDYTEVSTSTPETWSVTNAYEFGFSVLGNDVDTNKWGSDADCISTADVPSTTLKWQSFKGQSNIAIASSNSETTQSGTNITVCYATEQDTVFAPSGTYTATTTLTAITN